MTQEAHVSPDTRHLDSCESQCMLIDFKGIVCTKCTCAGLNNAKAEVESHSQALHVPQAKAKAY